MTRPSTTTTQCTWCNNLTPIEEYPFNAWLRANPDLDSRKDCIVVSDIDLLVHRYGTRTTTLPGTDRQVQYIMHVEVKTHNSRPTGSQWETLMFHSEASRTNPTSSQRESGRFIRQPTQQYRTVKVNGVQVIHYGLHLLQLSGATPDDSDRIMWDQQPITKDQLTSLLRFDLSPDSLRPMEHRQHSKRIDQLRLDVSSWG